MNMRIPGLLVLLVVALVALASPVAALPPVLEKAKKSGVVGEQADGYLGLVKGDASADVRKALKEVNQQRKALYEERAKTKGTDVATYAAIVGKTQVRREPAGNWVRTEKGWQKK